MSDSREGSPPGTASFQPATESRLEAGGPRTRLAATRTSSGLGGCVLGVDGGNSKTIALVARRDGTVVGAARGGCGDIYDSISAYGDIPEDAQAEAALQTIAATIQRALDAAGATPADLAAAAFSMAGADWPEDIAFLQRALEQRGFGRRITVVNDAIGALYAGSPDGTGVAVVCGTGAATGARGPDGRLWHTSHWQEPQGAEELGRRALRAVYRADLGIDPPTSLTARILDAYEQSSVEEVLHLFTSRLGPWPGNAGQLARVLLDEAERGDATARRIVEVHGAALGDYALAAARRVGIAETPFTLVLAGGVLRHPSPLLSAALVARVRAASPGVQPVDSRFEPAVGTLFMALEQAGVSVDEALVERLLPTLPPAALYAT